MKKTRFDCNVTIKFTYHPMDYKRGNEIKTHCDICNDIDYNVCFIVHHGRAICWVCQGVLTKYSEVMDELLLQLIFIEK